MDRYAQLSNEPYGFTSNGRPMYRKLPLIGLEWIFIALNVFFLAFTWIYTTNSLNGLPDQIPTHFDISGKPDRYGSKYTLLILPIIGTFVSILMHIVCFFPHRFNLTGITVTTDNAAKVYTVARTLLRYLGALTSALFIVLLVPWVKAAQTGEELSGMSIVGPIVGFLGGLAIGIYCFYSKARSA